MGRRGGGGGGGGGNDPDSQHWHNKSPKPDDEIREIANIAAFTCPKKSNPFIPVDKGEPQFPIHPVSERFLRK